MLIACLIIGLLFIGLGFLTRRYPGLIAGYNTMSAEKKKNVDIVKISALLRSGFIVIGAVIITCPFIFKLARIEEFTPLAILAVILAGTVVIIAKCRKYDLNPHKNNPLAWIVTAIVILFTAGMISYDFIPTKAVFEEGKVRFTGSYGVELSIDDIASVELMDKIPAATVRTNGTSVGNINKGTFMLGPWGKCRLLLNSGRHTYLVITKKSGEKVVFNNRDGVVTKDIYYRLAELRARRDDTENTISAAGADMEGTLQPQQAGAAR